MPGIEYRFRHQRQGNMAFEHGFVERARNLGESYLLNQIDFKKGDIFVDCGANTGDMKLWFLCNNIDVEYIGFEPSPVEFACLENNIAPSTAHNVALWRADCHMQFHVSSQGADSSLIKQAVYDHTIEVQTHRLERYINH
jgi:hypothetical protein